MSIRTTIALLLLSLPLCAQSWDELRGLKPGDRVKVHDVDGKEFKGEFVSVSPDTIAVDSNKGQVSIHRPRVRRVEVRSSGRRIRNTVIGAAIGVAVAVTVDQTLGTRLINEGNECCRPALYLAPIAGFAAVGALPAYRTVYRSR